MHTQVLQHLTKKRPVGVDRTQFFVHAEAFAVLVNIEFVSVDGALAAVIHRTVKPRRGCACVQVSFDVWELGQLGLKGGWAVCLCADSAVL